MAYLRDRWFVVVSAVALLSAAPCRSEAAENAPASVFAMKLGGLELVGLSQIGGDVRACIAVRGADRSQWLRLGAPGPLRFERYDAERQAVQLSDGANTAWLTIRESAITAVPVARRDDGSVDWTHLRMSDQEKATEGAVMVWDILEAGRLARAGQLPPPSPAMSGAK